MAPVQKDRITTSPPRPGTQGSGMITRGVPSRPDIRCPRAFAVVLSVTTEGWGPCATKRPADCGALCRERRSGSTGRDEDEPQRRCGGREEDEARGRGERGPLVDGRRGRRRDTGGRRARRCGRRRHARRRGPPFLLVAALAEERQLEVIVLAGGVVRGELEVEPVVLAALGLEVNRPDLVRVGRALNCIAPAVADPGAHLIRQTGQREALAVRWAVRAVLARRADRQRKGQEAARVSFGIARQLRPA